MAPVQFRDPLGVRWAVAPVVLGRGEDALPLGFQFTSEHGERRVALRDPSEFVSPREVDDDYWRAVLRSATVVI